MYPQRVLIVDDDPLVPSIAKTYFLASGVEHCDGATGAREALQLFEQFKSSYDLILLDISMPDMDGVELITALHQAGYEGWISIISAQHPTLCRTAMNIAASYGMKPAGISRKPIDRHALESFLQKFRLGQARAKPTNQLSDQLSAEEIEAAINNNRVVPFYQPIVELHSGCVTGAEALARIENEDGSIVFPNHFIAVAEQQDLLEPLTRQLFQSILRDIQLLNKAHPNLNIAVNWDPQLLEQYNLPDELLSTCEVWNVSPRQLTLEITETTAFEASPLILEVLVRLRLKGFGVAVDDYGTGYSNLDRLARMPFSKLKIDQSFVRKAGEDSFSMAGVETAIRLARELSMPTVAEGVEEESLWDLMRACGASQAQGYLISRPLPLKQFVEWGQSEGWRFDLPVRDTRAQIA